MRLIGLKTSSSVVSVVKAYAKIAQNCEVCKREAEPLFDNILDRMTGSHPSLTAYVLEVRAARCLQCWRGDFGEDVRRMERLRMMASMTLENIGMVRAAD